MKWRGWEGELEGLGFYPKVSTGSMSEEEVLGFNRLRVETKRVGVQESLGKYLGFNKSRDKLKILEKVNEMV